jgi:hypothetical protein
MIAMRRTRAFSVAVLVALAALAARGSAQDKAATDSSAQRAFLVRGAEPVKGLPFFAPNALPALSGAYSLRADAPRGAELPVWYTRASLVLGSSWKRAEGFGPSALLLARPQGRVLVLRAERYYLFFELPAQGGTVRDEQGRQAFIRAFERKFGAFFDNAPTDAELSFPAYVDY